MKITRIETIPALIPLSRPIATAIHSIESAGCLLERSCCDCMSVEHIDWFAPLLEQKIEPADGKSVIAQMVR